MLAVLYITSMVSSLLVSLFKKIGKEKSFIALSIISIFSGIMYIIPTYDEISKNIYDPNFVTILGLLLLIFWDFAFLSNDGANILNYIVAAFLGSGIICFLLSNLYFSDYLVFCNENHDYTECVSIITTIDGTDSGASIYGDGFTIGFIVNENPASHIYQYYYETEDGDIRSKKVHENYVEVTYISTNSEPYVEIYYSIDCSGYRNESKIHVFRRSIPTYHFYIPEGSIANISP